jgi:hypothetical protein
MAGESTEKVTKKEVKVTGTLTAEGVECQAMRQDKTNELYTLIPREKLAGFKNGDHVRVSGTIVEVSFCQQGTTIAISSISKV